MSHVNPARFPAEQNLVCVQVEHDIFYEACKDIAKDDELLVWYGELYLQFMGIPVALKESVTNGLNSRCPSASTEAESE